MELLICIADRTQLINRRLASDGVPSHMPTRLSSLPTSNLVSNQMPTSYPSQESAATSSAPTQDITSKYDDDDLALGVPTNLEGLDTSSSSHHSLPSGTFNCTAIFNLIYLTSKQQAFLPLFVSVKFFIKVALVVVIAVTCMTGILILGASFLLLHKMRTVQVKSKSDSLEVGAIPIAHEVSTNNGPVVVVEASLTTIF